MTQLTHSIDDLKRPENERALRIDWTVQRVGWLCMALILSAALLGYCGRGPLTKQHRTADDGSLSVQYYSVERYESPTELRIRLPKQSGAAKVRSLRLSKSFCDAVTIETWSPPVDQGRTEDGEVVYDFVASASEDLLIVCRYKYEQFGWYPFQLAVADGKPVSIRQLVLP
jgi:hypothetical protein